MTDLAVDQKLQIASEFISQAPPGEVNDVFNDIRTIIADDSAIETGLVSALCQYNLDQFISVDLPDLNRQALICDAAVHPTDSNRFLDSVSGKSFVFDHMRLVADDLRQENFVGPHESIRKALETSWQNYVTEHYHDGLVGVYSLTSPSPSSTSSSAPPPNPKPEGEEPSGEDEEPKPEGEDGEGENQPQAEAETEMKEEATGGQVGESELKKLFKVRSVGNRYNFANYWSGRWRSSWEVDLDKGELEATIIVNVHYYEQGNVQLSTTHQSTHTLPPNILSQTDPTTLSRSLLRLVNSLEGSFQTSLNEAYVDLAEKTFRGLRRALPVTRQKVDWGKITGYRLGEELGGAGGRPE